LLAKVPHIKFIVVIRPDGRAWYSKAVLEMARNDVTVNIEDGATHNNPSKRLLQGSSLVIKCNDVVSKAMNRVLDASERVLLA